MVAENVIAQYESAPLAVELRAAFDKVLALLPGEVRSRRALSARGVHFGELAPPNIRGGGEEGGGKRDQWASSSAGVKPLRRSDHLTDVHFALAAA